MYCESFLYRYLFLLFFQVTDGEKEFDWGIVVNFQKKANQSKVFATKCI